ncbi:thioredoxin [Palleronia pelagia]|uniref:Thioredoxin n=1 Tax=Palleronia pelagia TaxID=387096 RepID=A0A1H8FNN5_9RHOB|nr:thioredoxin [Palleronia pelagia]SEN33313.1 thioredoxin [Palleronia pelagia]
MIELGQGTAAPAAADLIKEGTEASFMADVVEASQQVPVIVDFWAPWCGPCKTLGPMLEKAVTEAKGAVKMVKIDIDRAQSIAAQLQIQSIPTVYAFYKGQPVDGFQGAIPQSEIKAFVDRLVAQGGGAPGGREDGLAEALQTAEDMLTAGQAEDAAQVFAAIAGEAPDRAAAHAGLVRAHIAMGDLEQAEAILNGVDASISHAPELEAAHAQLQLARQAADAGPVDDLRARVEADPDDHQARIDLAKALHATGNTEEAVDQLLESFRRDREWNDGAARAQLFTLFEALPPQDPVALKGRRRLSSMIFA